MQDWLAVDNLIVTYDPKLLSLVAAGRAVPKIKITKSNGKVSVFNTTWYKKHTRLTGSLTPVCTTMPREM